MTTIVAIAREGQVHMAADTMANVYDRPVHSVPKILRMTLWDGDTEALLGFTGDGALVKLAYRLDVSDSRPMSDDEVAQRIAEAVTTLATDHGLLTDGRMDAAVLFGYHGRLWTIDHQQAIPHPDGLAAVGSGEGPAIGALWVMSNASNQVVPDRGLVEIACHAGIRFDRYSGGDVQVESIGEEKTQ